MATILQVGRESENYDIEFLSLIAQISTWLRLEASKEGPGFKLLSVRNLQWLSQEVSDFAAQRAEDDQQ